MIIESAFVSCPVCVCRCGKDICHENIVATQRPNPGYMLNAVTAPVLYKLIHYFMENPIRDDTVLMHPIGEVEVRGSRVGANAFVLRGQRIEFLHTGVLLCM